VPLYEYQCGQCGSFELIRKFSDPALASCPTCGGEIQKLPSSPAIQFKGTGWYITDYARRDSGGKGEGGKGEGGKGEGGKGEGKDTAKTGSASPPSSGSKDAGAPGSTAPKSSAGESRSKK
jgi:putative FmdB family regulatory protein